MWFSSGHFRAVAKTISHSLQICLHSYKWIQMAKAVLVFVLLHVWFPLLCSSASDTQDVVFQPPYLTAHWPTVTALLLGNTSNVTLNLQTVSPSNASGSFGPPSCVPGMTQWILTNEQVGKTVVQVRLRLNRSLRLCGLNETDADCCMRPLCVLETLQVTACVGNAPQALLLIQVKIYSMLVSTNTEFDNKTVIQNQVYKPLGACPCDLTFSACDVRCCCDQDCSTEDLQLFKHHCLLGPFGGQVSTPEYQCSVQSQNSPDWFPFLCVTSPPENNPYLGLFYQGNTIVPKPGMSFGSSALLSPSISNAYIEGSPILTSNDQYFSIPRMLNGHCVTNAPVAFLKNFDVRCVTMIQSCPNEPPLQTEIADVRTVVKNGIGGDVLVDVTDKVATDLRDFILSRKYFGSSEVCENVTMALDYNFYWKGNGITQITVTRTVGTLILNGSVTITTRYSTTFINGDLTSEPNSGNPGYQVGKSVIGGIMNSSMENNTSLIQRASVNLWKPVNNGLCSTAETKPILFGENSTSGCLLPVSQQNLTQCSLLRDAVTSLQEALVKATFVARNGQPDALNMADWLNISFVSLNTSGTMESTNSSCTDVPSHLNILVWSLVTGFVDGIPQKYIKAMQISYSLSTWRLDCGGGDHSICIDPTETQLFPVTSSVTFIDIPFNTGPPKSRYQINFTEYDCSRNDVCWPELAFPITRFYTGEPYSQALAKGLILVFFFIAASVLGTPWRQIRQIWNSL